MGNKSIMALTLAIPRDMGYIQYENGKFIKAGKEKDFKKEKKKMFGKMDRAAIEATLGRGVSWVEDEDALEIVYLINKSIREDGLSAENQARYDALQELYCSGK